MRCSVCPHKPCRRGLGFRLCYDLGRMGFGEHFDPEPFQFSPPSPGESVITSLPVPLDGHSLRAESTFWVRTADRNRVARYPELLEIDVTCKSTMTRLPLANAIGSDANALPAKFLACHACYACYFVACHKMSVCYFVACH